MKSLRNKYPVSVVSLLLASLLAISPAQMIEASPQDYLAPQSVLKGDLYSPAIEFISPTQKASNWKEEVFIGFKELSLTFNPVRFLALHDNRKEAGSIDWLKLNSRIVGVGLVYTAMIAGPYFLGEYIIVQPSFLLSLILYISAIATFPLFNAESHNIYNFFAKTFSVGLLNISIPILASDEIAISQTAIKKLFVGDPYSLSKQMNKKLESESRGQSQVTLKGVLYFKRKSSSHIVWAFKESAKKEVATEFGFKLRGETPIPKLASDEISVSGPGLKKLFLGQSDLLPKQMNEKLERESKGKAQVTLNNVSYFKRKTGPHIVWAFKGSAKKEIATEFGFKLRGETPIPKLASDEIAVSGSGLTKLFVGKSDLFSKQMNEKLERESKGKEQVTLNDVSYFKRKTGPSTVWAFKGSAKKEVATEFGFKLRGEIPELASDEIAVSGPGLKEIFVGWSDLLLKQVNEKLERESKGKAQVTLNSVSYFKRKTGNHTVWAFKGSVKKEVATEFGFKLRGEIPELASDEISVSGSGLKELFVGRSVSLSKQMNEKLDSKSKGKAQVSLNSVSYFKRKAGNHTVWAFKGSVKKEVATEFGFKLRGEIPELASDEIAVSRSGLTKLFIGQSGLLSKQMKEKLESESKGKAQVTLNSVSYFKRKARRQTVWAFKENAKRDVATEFGFKFRNAINEDVEEKIESLNLAEAIALLGNDPLRLQQYIRIYHPDLSTEEVDQIVVTSLNGLRAEWAEEGVLHEDYDEVLSLPEFGEDYENNTIETEESSFEISGQADSGASYIQVTGAYTRKIRVRQDGTFSANIPLPRIGKINEFSVYAVNEESEERSSSQFIQIEQTATLEDAEEAFLRLIGLKEEVLASIHQNPAQYNFIFRSMELALLRHFTQNEKEGLKYLKTLLYKESSKAKKAILKTIEVKFKKIAKRDYDLKQGERLYFFQKYVVYETQRLMEEGEANGVLIANEQGLGKTVTALVAANGHDTVILTPNPVVTSWKEQQAKFFEDSSLTALDGTYRQRANRLKNLDTSQVVTNIEYTRGMNKRKAGLLSREEGVLIVDEADYLGSGSSQQAKGTAQIEAGFKILLSATPFKKISQIGRILGFLRPNDSRFKSARAFARAFPSDDPEALNALFLLMQQHMLRIRKRDVFEEYDPKIALEKQSNKLPRKVEVDPLDQETGQFELTSQQSHSILQLFTNYQQWCQQHRGHESDEDSRFHRFDEGYFSKKEALRQIMNDPAYIGLDIESPKHLRMDKIVEQELMGKENHGKKILIFTRYKAQVKAYLDRYQQLGVRSYYGGLAQNSNGYRVNENGKVLYYQVNEDGNFMFDENHQFILATKKTGMPVRALDYERILFQNDPNSRVMIATYDSGSVGVTLTAADVVVYDDLAPTYRDQYQAGDRAHRIDNGRKKYNVKYYWLQALYSESFLQGLPQEVREEFFTSGTFDQVHLQNLRRQGHIFHRIMDGVGSDDELTQLNRRFMREHMPFLFARGEANDKKETGFIASGEEALAEFRDKRDEIEQPINDFTSQYKNGLVFLLSVIQQLMGHSNEARVLLKEIQSRIDRPDFKVYRFESIVKGPDDYVLAHYDQKRNVLYLATDVLESLRNKIPSPLYALTDEFILHELLCPTFSHYLAINLQQQIFESHYPNRRALGTQPFLNPYKGLLGNALREYIERKLHPAYNRITPIKKRYSPKNRLREINGFEFFFEKSA